MLQRLSAGFGATALAGMFGTQANAIVPQQATAKANKAISVIANSVR